MKEYIKPTINIQKVVVEQLLAGESGGQGGEPGNEWDAKRNDFFWSDEENEADEIAINDIWE